MKKGSLFFVAVFISALVIYGTAFMMNLVDGHFLFKKGLMDYGYLLLLLGIAIPSFLYIVLIKNKHTKNMSKVIIGSLVYPLVLFVPVYLTLSFEDTTITTDIITTLTVIVLTITTIFISILHLNLNRSKN